MIRAPSDGSCDQNAIAAWARELQAKMRVWAGDVKPAQEPVLPGILREIIVDRARDIKEQDQEIVQNQKECNDIITRD